ncbi:Uncharacterised protein [Mycobacteroides abscessus]|uniref:Bacteriophage protein n=4 Tax=Mycobacteroides abscessus TaxID=36809 RepID=A0ABD7HWA4_9MYCO|nr:hypothetical protein [Mycobacteroides abscessus]AMU24303.1 hypothetical protein A3N96_01720 [Mycobacteroides abscessus]AMU34034.1 hypothetical protein A3N98_01185 [Mycobacteroides abscessus]AMU38975.1 hypothetical protein A3N99_01185 [Mycobacteroides abscessus]AMU59027.1 hypothetical protein A3O03_01720 [Mycobacteroides abscessus]MBN7344546.1 hypothetical protein [Mycobacteroides abscessus subsp. massiliense]
MTNDDDDLTAEEWAEVCVVAARFDWIVTPPTKAADLLPKMLEINALQKLENEIMDAHGDWLASTRQYFEERGWPWTTEELNRRYQLGQWQ